VDWPSVLPSDNLSLEKISETTIQSDG